MESEEIFAYHFSPVVRCAILFQPQNRNIVFLSISPHTHKSTHTLNCRVMCTRAKQFIAFVTISVMCINILVTLFCRMFWSQAMCDCFVFGISKRKKETKSAMVGSKFFFIFEIRTDAMKIHEMPDHTNRRTVPTKTN